MSFLIVNRDQDCFLKFIDFYFVSIFFIINLKFFCKNMSFLKQFRHLNKSIRWKMSNFAFWNNFNNNSMFLTMQFDIELTFKVWSSIWALNIKFSLDIDWFIFERYSFISSNESTRNVNFDKKNKSNWKIISICFFFL